MIPFRYHVIDPFWPDAELIRAAALAVPPPEHPRWIEYDTPTARKRTLRDPDALPTPIARLLAELQAQRWVDAVGAWLGIDDLRPDPLLRGGALHVMGPGDFLHAHLDSSIHAVTGLERRANLILFLSEWMPWWGGELILRGVPGSPESVRPGISPDIHILPAANRGVLWECTEASWHGVAELRCPADRQRASLAIYYWSAPRPGASRRDRAEFAGE